MHVGHVLPHWCRGVSPFGPPARMAPQGHPPQALEPTVFRARGVPHTQLRDFQNLSPDCPPPTCRSVTPDRYFVSPREATAREAVAHPPWIPHEGDEQSEGDRPGGGRERKHRGEVESGGPEPP